jgi:Tfp pilus assembly protein PilX
MRYKTNYSSGKRRRNRKDERGVALLTSLLLLLLMTGLSVAMVMSVRSDLLVNGYYRNFRGSFYAADSGLNIARQSIVNQINADLATLGAGYNPATTVPLSASEDSTIQSNLNTTYGQSYQSINTGNASKSWPGKYKITNASFTFLQCVPLGATGTCPAPVGSPTGYRYIYNYSLTSVGQSDGSEAITLSDSGSVFVNAVGAGASTQTSFAAWGMFINTYNICDGSTLVPGTISGPVFTNGSWNFGTSGKYIFTDPVGQNGVDAGYQFGSGCDQVAGPSDQKGGTTIAPTFQHGFNLNQPKIPLPPNDYNQERAVLDGTGTSGTQVTKQDLNNNLRDATGAAYPKGGASSGVFLPYTVDSNGKNPKFSGGGILVQGNAQVTLTPGANGTAQIYTIVQNGVTSTITVDGGGKTDGTGTTTFTSGGNTVVINGVPVLKDPATGNITGDDTMLYVNGNITSLSGPGQGVPAIQDGTALTITASGNVTITGDILYKTEPVTLTQTNVNGQTVPADTLIPGNNKGQALGIFTATGDIQLNNNQSNGNLEIDASLATISQNGTGGLTNIGNTINTLNIVGGRIQNNIKNINTVTRNVFFDRRYGQGFAPPWFPSTNVTVAPGAQPTFTTSVSRTQWVNTTSYN